MRTPIVLLTGPAYSGKDTAAKVIATELNGTVISLADPIKRFLSDPEGFGLTVEQLWGKQKEELFLRKQPSVGVMTQLAEAHFGIEDPDMVDALSGALEEWEGSLPKTTTSRHMMQTLGTDCVRSIDDDFWIDYGLALAETLLKIGGEYERETGIVDSEKYPSVVVIPDGRFRNEVLPVLEMGGAVLKIERPRVGADVLSAVAQQHASEMQQNTIPRWWYSGVLTNGGTLAQFEENVRRWCHERRFTSTG